MRWLTFLLRKYFYIILLSIIAIISHHEWFTFGTVLTYSDWTYRFDEMTKELVISFGPWLTYLNLGYINIQVYFFSFMTFWSFFTNLNFSYDTAVKFTFLIPTALLGFISPYYLVKKITTYEFISFVSALFYGTITYFLTRQAVHLPIAFVFSLAPLIFYFFIESVEKNKIYNWIIFSLISFLGVCYEIRMMYIVFLILLIYFCFFNLKFWKRYIKTIPVAVILTILLNLFWFLPTFLGGANENIGSVTSRSIFGSFLFSTENAFTVFYPTWTGGYMGDYFSKQPILIYFWIIPLILFSVLFFKHDKYKKQVIFFGLITLLGILLTKQEAEPFPTIYVWLYEHFPGFNLFRVSSKFYLITSLGYLGLLSYLLSSFKEHRNKLFSYYLYKITSVLIILLSLLNLFPLITGQIRQMFEPRHIPKDYIVFKDLIYNDREFFRTFWIPRDSKWGFYSMNKPKISGIDIMQTSFKDFCGSINGNKAMSLQETTMCLFNDSALSQSIFEVSSVKYVVIPIEDDDNEDNFFVYYGAKSDTDIRKWYINQLESLPWLKKIDIETKELVVFENENYKPHIYSSKGLNYTFSNASNFGFFEKNDTLYLNSKFIEKQNRFLKNIDNIIIPVSIDSTEIQKMEQEYAREIDKEKKKQLKTEFDNYKAGYFFKDFVLKVPVKQKYKVYMKKESLVAKSNDIQMKIGNTIIKQKYFRKGIQNDENIDWKLINEVEMEVGQYPLELYVKGEKVNALGQEDIVFSAEDLVFDIPIPKLEYKQLTPSKYVVNVIGASQSFPLVFSESFHTGWKVFVQSAQLKKEGNNFVGNENQGTIQNENLDGGKFYDIFKRTYSIDENHFTVNNFANGWWVDLESLEKQGKIIKNVDGTYDFSLILEFYPQKYFYIGLLISSITLFGCVFFLLYKVTLLLYNRIKKRPDDHII